MEKIVSFLLLRGGGSVWPVEAGVVSQEQAITVKAGDVSVRCLRD